MVYQHTYTIGMEDIGLNNRATGKALLAMMEDIGGLHSAEVGYGVLDIETKKRAWVLLDWQVQIKQRPVYNETVNAYTWSRKVERACAYRDFELRTQDGTIAAIGSSRWLLFDTERRRPVRLTQEIAELYQTEETHRVFEEEITNIEFDEAALSQAEKTSYKVLRRDIDLNRHMHNISYLEAAYEALPQEVYDTEAGRFEKIRIQYKREIKYGDEVACAYLKQEKGYAVVMMVGDKIHAVISFQ